MKKNVGTSDKVIRFIIAGIVLLMYLTGFVTGTLGVILLVLAGILVLTGLIGFCGLYAVLGINTCNIK